MESKDKKTVYDIVEEESGVTFEEIMSGCRKRHIINAKRILGVALRRHTKESLEKIGYILGMNGHATVLHYVRTHEGVMNSDYEFRKLFVKINTRIKDYLNGDMPVEKKLEVALDRRDDLNLEIIRLRKLVKIKNEQLCV